MGFQTVKRIRAATNVPNVRTASTMRSAGRRAKPPCFVLGMTSRAVAVTQLSQLLSVMACGSGTAEPLVLQTGGSRTDDTGAAQHRDEGRNWCRLCSTLVTCVLCPPVPSLALGRTPSSTRIRCNVPLKMKSVAWDNAWFSCSNGMRTITCSRMYAPMRDALQYCVQYFLPRVQPQYTVTFNIAAYCQNSTTVELYCSHRTVLAVPTIRANGYNLSKDCSGLL